MGVSIITRLGLFVKGITGIKDFSLLKKKTHKEIGKLVYHKNYTANDIVRVMQRLGMKKGSVVCIHASMMEFYNYKGTAEELITAVMKVLTQEGTLLMPAFPDPLLQKDANYIFDKATAPTKAGYLAETFRTFPGVVRSINVQHSVCAWGQYAEWLTKDHHKSTNCWDELSPWYRMTKFNALVFSIGLPKFYIGTFVHCVEAILYKEHPYWAQFFTEEKTYRYLTSSGEVKEYTCLEGNLERRSREGRIIKKFPTDCYQHTRLSNLSIKVFHSAPCLQKMLELGRRGVTIYYVPSPSKYNFEQ